MATASRRLNPFAAYRQMRQEFPVYRDPRTGVWSVYRYDDVQTVLSDFHRFGSGHDDPHPEAIGPGASIIGLNPPAHRKMRDLVSRAFTPRAVDQMAGRIRGLVESLLSRCLVAGRFDVVDDFSAQLPVLVIAEMLGIPTEDRPQFKAWSDQIVAGTENHALGRSATRAMSEYFSQVIQDRRQRPDGDDLISSLIRAEVDGRRLTDAEVISFCDLLLVAGNETTTNLITNAVWTFAEQPEVWEALRTAPEVLPDAIEEVLRYRSPVQAMFRHVRHDMSWHDQEFRAGERVIAWIGSANHDGEKFAEAEDFDLHRKPNPHLAFGYGIHYCLGAPLARLESRLTFEALLAAGVTRYELLAPSEELMPVEGWIVLGLKHLPVKVTR